MYTYVYILYIYHVLFFLSNGCNVESMYRIQYRPRVVILMNFTLSLKNLLNPGYNQPRALAGQGPTQREEAVAPVSIKEFALENFG